MNTESLLLRKITLKPTISLIFLLAIFIIFMPSDWERLKFFFFLCFPIAFSTEHFNFNVKLMKKSLLFLGLFILANLTALWLHIWQLKWELSNPDGLFGWKIYIDGWLSSIPFNDGMWLRQFSTPFFDQIFVTIYIHGFVLCLLALAIYYLLTAQPKKILIAMFAGHFLQYIFILPFHFWIDGHQVWWIQNQWYGFQFQDPLEGYRTLTELTIPSLNNVFPSMHTSIATIIIILALREHSKPIKYFFSILNIGVIFSTVYLGIHWVVDVFGGILFGIITLKITDWIMEKDWETPSPLKQSMSTKTFWWF